MCVCVCVRVCVRVCVCVCCRAVLAPAVSPGTCGTLVETFQCSVDACPRNCTVSEWSAWSVCTGPCERGSRSRTRAVVAAADPGGSCDVHLWDSLPCLQPEPTLQTVLYGVISPLLLGVVEGQGPSAYSLSLTAPVNASARLSFCSPGLTQGAFTINPPFIDFTPTNWNATTIVYVQPTTSDVDMSGVFHSISHKLVATSGPAFATDPFFLDIKVTVIDRQTSNVYTSVSALRISEGDSTTYTIALSSRPVQPVQVAVVSSCFRTLITPNVITFSGVNWNTPRVITLSVADDTIDNVR
jgi:hypothetical protein